MLHYRLTVEARYHLEVARQMIERARDIRLTKLSGNNKPYDWTVFYWSALASARSHRLKAHVWKLREPE